MPRVLPKGVRPTPWDSDVFGIPTYELKSASPTLLRAVRGRPGHFTVRVSPLGSKKALLENGFYYADTLVKPRCRRAAFVRRADPAVTIGREPLAAFTAMVPGAFVFGRFHRDPNIPRRQADRRYALWLGRLYAKRQVLGLRYKGRPAGFIGYDRNRLVLHALAPRFRGRGLAKYFWSAACARLFREGRRELESSVSASNLAAVNLYASLGFRFRRAVDVYHRFQKS